MAWKLSVPQNSGERVSDVRRVEGCSSRRSEYDRGEIPAPKPERLGLLDHGETLEDCYQLAGEVDGASMARLGKIHAAAVIRARPGDPCDPPVQVEIRPLEGEGFAEPDAGSRHHQEAGKRRGSRVLATSRTASAAGGPARRFRGSYVTTSLIAEGVWSCGVSVQAALCDANFFPLHDRQNPPNPAMNLYRTADDSWLMLILLPSKWPEFVNAIGRGDLASDARFADPATQAANAAALTAILDEVFGSQPLAHWREVLDQQRITYGIVRGPSEVIRDPQLLENDVIVPLAGAGGKLTSTISSPFRVHDVTKVPAQRAPELGEHNEEILAQLGFDANAIVALRASGAIAISKK